MGRLQPLALCDVARGMWQQFSQWWRQRLRQLRELPSPRSRYLQRDEFSRAQARLRYRKFLRYTQIIILLTAFFMVLLAISMVAGCALSDRHIDRHLATTYARVETVDSTRTYVSFVDRTGQVVNPDRGVFYPTGVRPGELVRIDYDSTNPNYARISGRSWKLSLVPALSFLLCTMPWFGLAFAVVGRLRVKAGGLIRRTHWGGAIAGISFNNRRTMVRMRAATAPPPKRVA